MNTGEFRTCGPMRLRNFALFLQRSVLHSRREFHATKQYREDPFSSTTPNSTTRGFQTHFAPEDSLLPWTFLTRGGMLLQSSSPLIHYLKHCIWRVSLDGVALRLYHTLRPLLPHSGSPSATLCLEFGRLCVKIALLLSYGRKYQDSGETLRTHLHEESSSVPRFLS